jgi:glucose-1-phosphate thymidylyltransferase
MPLTKIVSKQLLPVYDKPLVYYPLTTLLLAGISNICIITAVNESDKFRKVLGNGQDLGINLTYLEQEKASGIAESLLIGEEFLGGEKCALILGDNIFHGSGLGRRLSTFLNVSGSHVFGYHVKNTSSYGIATIDSNNKVVGLEEKPKSTVSKIAIPGLYFLDEYASGFAKTLTPSPRGELEILDLLKIYKNNSSLSLEMLPRGTAWFDSGTFEDMHEASAYVRLMQERSGERVGDPFEVARLNKWI